MKFAIIHRGARRDLSNAGILRMKKIIASISPREKPFPSTGYDRCIFIHTDFDDKSAGQLFSME